MTYSTGLCIGAGVPDLVLQALLASPWEAHVTTLALDRAHRAAVQPQGESGVLAAAARQLVAPSTTAGGTIETAARLLLGDGSNNEACGQAGAGQLLIAGCTAVTDALPGQRDGVVGRRLARRFVEGKWTPLASVFPEYLVAEEGMRWRYLLGALLSAEVAFFGEDPEHCPLFSRDGSDPLRLTSYGRPTIPFAHYLLLVRNLLGLVHGEKAERADRSSAKRLLVNLTKRAGLEPSDFQYDTYFKPGRPKKAIWRRVELASNTLLLKFLAVRWGLEPEDGGPGGLSSTGSISSGLGTAAPSDPALVAGFAALRVIEALEGLAASSLHGVNFTTTCVGEIEEACTVFAGGQGADPEFLRAGVARSLRGLSSDEPGVTACVQSIAMALLSEPPVVLVETRVASKEATIDSRSDRPPSPGGSVSDDLHKAWFRRLSDWLPRWSLPVAACAVVALLSVVFVVPGPLEPDTSHSKIKGSAFSPVLALGDRWCPTQEADAGLAACLWDPAREPVSFYYSLPAGTGPVYVAIIAIDEAEVDRSIVFGTARGEAIVANEVVATSEARADLCTDDLCLLIGQRFETTAKTLRFRVLYSKRSFSLDLGGQLRPPRASISAVDFTVRTE